MSDHGFWAVIRVPVHILAGLLSPNNADSQKAFSPSLVLLVAPRLTSSHFWRLIIA